jgi:hypothetical protein
MKVTQELMFKFLSLELVGYQQTPSKERFILARDTLNNNAGYEFPDDATALEIFDHVDEKRKQFGLKIDYTKKEISNVASEA